MTSCDSQLAIPFKVNLIQSQMPQALVEQIDKSSENYELVYELFINRTHSARTNTTCPDQCSDFVCSYQYCG
jgi:hypothetical protein